MLLFGKKNPLLLIKKKKPLPVREDNKFERKIV